jgi:hypothetical protein
MFAFIFHLEKVSNYSITSKNMPKLSPFGMSTSSIMETGQRDPERPFTCDSCGRAFKLKCHLKRHQSGTRCTKRTIIPPKFDLTCRECGRQFSRFDNLVRHNKKPCVNRESDNPAAQFKCGACGNTFTQVGSLRRHQRERCPILRGGAQILREERDVAEREVQHREEIMHERNRVEGVQGQFIEHLQEENKQLREENKTLKSGKPGNVTNIAQQNNIVIVIGTNDYDSLRLPSDNFTMITMGENGYDSPVSAFHKMMQNPDNQSIYIPDGRAEHALVKKGSGWRPKRVLDVMDIICDKLFHDLAESVQKASDENLQGIITELKERGQPLSRDFRGSTPDDFRFFAQNLLNVYSGRDAKTKKFYQEQVGCLIDILQKLAPKMKEPLEAQGVL